MDIFLMMEQIEELLYKKDWERIIEKYYQRRNKMLLCLFEEKIRLNTFKILGNVIYQPQKNMNNIVKENYKNWLL